MPIILQTTQHKISFSFYTGDANLNIFKENSGLPQVVKLFKKIFMHWDNHISLFCFSYAGHLFQSVYG
uniref:Uncharacterized protein n=1 Tax=Arion vulgaris TaxID=1028688 RepID=A0A0B7AYE7_9EUPU